MTNFRLRHLACGFALLVLAVLAAPRVAAQGLPLIPPPITTPELLDYADMIGLSDQQRVNLLSAHDEYKARYHEFEDRDVRKLIDSVLDMAMKFAPNRFSIPERKEIEDLVSQYKQIRSAASAVDRQFFDTLAGTLTEEQVLKLQRVRTARELRSYRDLVRGMAGQFNPGARVNLSEMLRHDAELAPQEREQVEAILTEYEPQLLSRTREVYNEIEKAITVALDVVDSLGIRGLTTEQMMARFMEEEDRTALFTNLQNTFNEKSKPFQAAAFEVSQLNLRTFKRLHAVLAPDHAEAFRDRYYRRVYGDAYSGAAEWRDRYRIALKMNELNEDQKQAISAQRDTFVRQEDALVDPIVSDLEDSRKYRTFMQLENEERQGLNDRMEDLNARRADLTQSANATLAGLLGPELLAALDEEVKKKGAGAAQAAAALAVARAEAEARVAVEVRHAQGEAAAEGEHDVLAAIKPFLPDPLTLDDFDHMKRRLALDAGQGDVIRSLYDDYRGKYDEAKSAAVVLGEVGADEAESPATVEAEARQKRCAELAALDQTFFDDVGLMLADEGAQQMLQRHRAARERAAANRIASLLSSRWMSHESYVDLIALVLKSEVEVTAFASLGDVIDAYAHAITPVVSERLEAAETLHRVSTSFRMINERGTASPQARELVMEKWRDSIAAQQRTNRKANQVNRQTLADMVARLPSDAAWSLKQAYNRIAYPDIYEDPMSAEAALAKALELPDLTPGEMDAITRITQDYRMEYAAACEKMVEFRSARRDDREEFEMPRRDDIDRELNLERARFDREEISNRARARLMLAVPAAAALARTERPRDWWDWEEE